MAICEHCGKEFSPKRTAKYCSSSCRARASDKRRMGLPKPPPPPKPTIIVTCPVCGKEFSPKRKDGVFCSDKCRVKAHSRKTALSKNETYRKVKAQTPQSALQILKLVEEGVPIEKAIKSITVAQAEQTAVLAIDDTRKSAGMI